MRLRHASAFSASAFLTASLLALSTTVSANPYPRLASDAPGFEIANALEIRACANPCGYYGQVCCDAGQYCYTDSSNQAQCGTGSATAVAGAGAAVSTVTLTVIAGATATAATCNVQLGQQQCGSTCCNTGQFCNSGICMSNGATTGGLPAVATQTVSAAIRPTSITTYTVITTNGVTSTVPFLMPATATPSSMNGTLTDNTSGTSLSGGAIAGIVIGVIAGIIILILLIICCCARGLLDLFRPKRKSEVTEVYESHHHGGGGPPPRRFGGLFGGGGNAGRQDSGKSGWLGIAGVLGALALLLGLKRRHDRKNDEKESTAYTYSDYTYDYSTSASSESSDDRRTRQSGARSDRQSSRR